jgi:hypothetical protein
MCSPPVKCWVKEYQNLIQLLKSDLAIFNYTNQKDTYASRSPAIFKPCQTKPA